MPHFNNIYSPLTSIVCPIQGGHDTMFIVPPPLEPLSSGFSPAPVRSLKTGPTPIHQVYRKYKKLSVLTSPDTFQLPETEEGLYQSSPVTPHTKHAWEEKVKTVPMLPGSDRVREYLSPALDQLGRAANILSWEDNTIATIELHGSTMDGLIFTLKIEPKP